MNSRSVRWVAALAAVFVLGQDRPSPGQSGFPPPTDARAVAQRLDAQFLQLLQAIANEAGTDTPEAIGALDHAQSLERVARSLLQTLGAPRPNPVTVRVNYQNINQSWLEFRQTRLGPPPLVSTPGVIQVVRAIDQTNAQLGALVNGGGGAPGPAGAPSAFGGPAGAPSAFGGPAGADPLDYVRSIFPPGQYGSGVPPAPADLKTLVGRLDAQLRQLGQAVVGEVGTESLEGFGAFDHARSLDKVVTQFAQTLASPEPDSNLLRSQYRNIRQSWDQYHNRLGTPPLISTPRVIASSQAVDQTVDLLGDVFGGNAGGGGGPGPDPQPGPTFP